MDKLYDAIIHLRLSRSSVRAALKSVLLVLDETVSELNSTTVGVAANSPEATDEVIKAVTTIRLRQRLFADCVTVGSGRAPAYGTRCSVVVTMGGSVLIQILEHGSQIIKEMISTWDLLRVTRRRHERCISRFCSAATTMSNTNNATEVDDIAVFSL
jgi:hypothetical protein